MPTPTELIKNFAARSQQAFARWKEAESQASQAAFAYKSHLRQHQRVGASYDVNPDVFVASVALHQRATALRKAAEAAKEQYINAESIVREYVSRINWKASNPITDAITEDHASSVSRAISATDLDMRVRGERGRVYVYASKGDAHRVSQALSSKGYGFQQIPNKFEAVFMVVHRVKMV